MSKVNGCVDCGPVKTIHFVEWSSVVLGWLIDPVVNRIETVRRIVAKSFSALRAERLEFLFMKFCALIRLCSFNASPDEMCSGRTRCMWEEAAKRGIEVKELRLLGRKTNIFVASYNNRITIFEGLPRPANHSLESASWMDNKGKMRERFMSAGIPIAKGGVCFTEKSALKLFRALKAPVIVKPNIGSRSRHTTIHIMNEEDLINGFRIAKKLSPLVVIEEELKGGTVYRPTLVGGKLIAVISKEPPNVVGDGVSSVRALIDKENNNPKRIEGSLFHPIAIDKDAEKELLFRGLMLESIPEKGRFVTLSQKTSRGIGGATTDYTGTTHPVNKELFEKVGKIVKDPLIGIDFMIEDITKPWTEQARCGVIECNSLPFIDLHHYPLYGKSQNVAGALWDLVFPGSKQV